MAQALNTAAPKAGRKPPQTAKAKSDDPAGIGHNAKAPLTREEKAALLQHHIGELRKLEAQVEVVRAPFKAAQEAVTKAFHAAKAELGGNYSRKYLAGLMEDFGARLRNVAAVEEQRFQDRVALGLPVFGKQMDLFGDAKTDTEKDAISAEADGYMAGRRGDEPKPPSDIGPLTQAWMAGFHKGQEETGKQVAMAMEVRARKSKPAEPEKDPDEEVEADLDAQARKLKRSGFTARTSETESAAA